LPKERVFDEFKKILLKPLKPSKAFILLKQPNGFRYFKHFSKLLEKEFENILLSLDFFASNKHNSDKTNLVIMLAIVIKPFDDEDKKGFLEKLTDEKKLISQSIKLSKIEFDVENFDEYELNILSTKTDIEIYAKFLNSIHQDKTFSSKLLAKAKSMGILNSRPTPIINGKELIEMGLKPSKNFKDILNKTYDAQLKGLFDNVKDGKKYAIIIATNK
jgi:tRNA nucleotidyltransferase (CCA-adding enzyme)